MGEAISGSACSPTPINHTGKSKAGVTCDSGMCITRAQEDRHQWDSSISACAEVRGQCRARVPRKKLIPNQPPFHRITTLQNQYSFNIWVTTKRVGLCLRGGNA